MPARRHQPFLGGGGHETTSAVDGLANDGLVVRSHLWYRPDDFVLQSKIIGGEMVRVVLGLLLASTASAADVDLTWQARLTDTDGAALNGAHIVTLTLTDDASMQLWSKRYIGIDFQDGYTSVMLSGDDDSQRPLVSSFFTGTVYVSVAVDDATPLSPAQAIATVPRAAAVVGSVRVDDGGVSNPSGACSTEQLGSIVFDGDDFFGCSSSGWGPLGGVLGGGSGTQDNPATSCDQLAADGQTVDGAYWLQPTTTPFQAFCHFSGSQGWTLIWKATSTATTFGYNSSYWSTPNVLNEADFSVGVGDAKYRAFNQLPFSDIRVCVNTPTANCFSHTMNASQDSALALFSGPYLAESITAETYDSFNTVFGSTTHKDCPPGLNPGFNATGGDSTRARWGHISNYPGQPCQNGAADDGDGSIGLGVQNHAVQNVSAGFHYEHDIGGAGPVRPRNAWLWVR